MEEKSEEYHHSVDDNFNRTPQVHFQGVTAMEYTHLPVQLVTCVNCNGQKQRMFFPLDECDIHNNWCHECMEQCIQDNETCPNCPPLETIMKLCLTAFSRQIKRKEIETARPPKVSSAMLVNMGYISYPDDLLVDMKRTVKCSSLITPNGGGIDVAGDHAAVAVADGVVNTNQASGTTAATRSRIELSAFRRSKLSGDSVLTVKNWNFSENKAAIIALVISRLNFTPECPDSATTHVTPTVTPAATSAVAPTTSSAPTTPAVARPTYPAFLEQATKVLGLYRDLVANANVNGVCDEVTFIQPLLCSLHHELAALVFLEGHRSRIVGSSCPLSRDIGSTQELHGFSDIEVTVGDHLSLVEAKACKIGILCRGGAFAEKDQAVGQCYCLRGILKNRSDAALSSPVAVCTLTDLFVNCCVLGVQSGDAETYYVSERVTQSEDYLVLLLLCFFELRKEDIRPWLSTATDRKIMTEEEEMQAWAVNKSVGTNFVDEFDRLTILSASSPRQHSKQKKKTKTKKLLEDQNDATKSNRSDSTTGSGEGKTMTKRTPQQATRSSSRIAATNASGNNTAKTDQQKKRSNTNGARTTRASQKENTQRDANNLYYTLGESMLTRQNFLNSTGSMWAMERFVCDL